MLNKLRLRLAVICVAMTGGVLAALMLTVAVLTERQYLAMEQLMFQNTVASLVSRLQTETLIDTAWLAQTEAAQSCVIAVESGGYPLRFSSRAANQSILVDAAHKRSIAQTGFNIRIPPLDVTQPTQIAFAMDGKKQAQYHCVLVKIPAQESWLSLTVIFDRAAALLQLRNQRFFYLALALAVFAVLCALSWWFTGKAVRPTAESIERQREFVAAASHELRAPLTVIAATASAVRVVPAQAQELTAKIESECIRLGRLVNDLLLLANTDTAAWQLHLSPVEPDAILIETVEKFEQAARNNGFTIALMLPNRVLPRIKGDAARLEQIVSILLDNAISHAGSGGTISVCAEQTRQYMQISVIDHGKGIAPPDRQRVFDRFYQADASRTDKSHFGLGLSVAKELVRLHHGSIELSETAGGGCTFLIKLPVAPAQQTSG